MIAPPKVELPEALPPYYRVRYAADEGPGQLVYGVSYTVWIPPGVQRLRGVIVHQHGCGEGACRAGQTAAFDLHWQALARKHACALLGPSYEQPESANCQLWCDPRHGSEAKFLQALEDLARMTSHQELSEVPWALWGHSGGATWVGTMLMLHPDRVACVWLRSGAPRLGPREGSALPELTIPDAAYSVPAMCNLGTQEGVTVTEGRFAKVWENVKSFFETMRGRGSLIGVSVDPNSSHDCGNQRYLAIPWIDECLSQRLGDADATRLRPMATERSWLAPLLGDKAVPAAAFAGPAVHSVWLPGESVAQAWMEYTKDGSVSDQTAPPAPTDVRVTGKQLHWQAEADLESGLAGFIIFRNGTQIARLPPEGKSPFGRPIFQRNSYSDTPSQPMSNMIYADQTAEPAGDYRYTVAALNTVGLQSPATVAVKDSQ